MVKTRWKKQPAWLKLGIIFLIVSVVYEILKSLLAVLMKYGFSGLGSLIIISSKLLEFPLFVIHAFSGYIIIYLSDYATGFYILPNLFGLTLIFLFWFLVGALVGWIYEKVK